jgi:hypothetical protein
MLRNAVNAVKAMLRMVEGQLSSVKMSEPSPKSRTEHFSLYCAGAPARSTLPEYGVA